MSLRCLTSILLALAMVTFPGVAIAPISMARSCPGHWYRLIKIEISPTGSTVELVSYFKHHTWEVQCPRSNSGSKQGR